MHLFCHSAILPFRHSAFSPGPVCTVNFTSHGMPVAVAAGNLWFVCAIGCNVNVANRTNHKFPDATPTGVPCEVKSTVQQFVFALKSISIRRWPCVSTAKELVVNPKATRPLPITL